MTLKITIGKADYEALSDEVKAFYIADGDHFKLDADYEDVGGLKLKTTELLAEIKKQKALIEKYGDLDPDAARAALEARQAAEDEKLKAEGQFEELKKKLEDRHAVELQTANAGRERLLENLKRERLQNYLVERGVLADRASYAFVDVGEQIELASDDSGFSLRLKNGIGDAKELDAMVEGLKAKSPFLFSADAASGGGASGSGGNSGNGSGVKTMKRDAFTQLPPAQQMTFSLAGGTLTD